MRVEYDHTSEDYAQAVQNAAPRVGGILTVVLIFVGAIQIYWGLAGDGGQADNAGGETVSLGRALLGHMLWIALIVAFWVLIFRALRAQARPAKARPWALPTICVVTWCCVAGVWIANPAHDGAATNIARMVLLVPLIAVGAAARPLLAWVQRRVALKNWEGMEHLHGRHPVETTETGFNLYSSLWSAAYRWEAIREVQETRDVLVLKVARVAFLMVPRRAFASQQDYELFRWMASEKRTYQPPPIPPVGETVPVARLQDAASGDAATGAP